MQSAVVPGIEDLEDEDTVLKEIESSDGGSDAEVKPTVTNRFDLLLGSASESEEDASKTKTREKQEAGTNEGAVINTASIKPQKKRTRKKKRKNSAKGRAVTKDNDLDWDALLDESADKEKVRIDEGFQCIPDDYFRKTDDEQFRAEANEIFKAICDIVASQRAEEAKRGKLDTDTNSALLTSLSTISVEPRLLSADAELKKLFGFKVVEAERRSEKQETANRVQRRGRGRKHVFPRSYIRRKFSLVNPREDWFSEVPGLSMVIDTDAPLSEDGIRYFRYTHEGHYENVQREYRNIVAMHDVNSLAALASRHPYHVDSLIQLAEVHRQMGELDRAAEQIERSLHVLECSWNMAFRPFQGDCRLRFEVPENKAIYIALFRYAQLLTRRGLHRTALEISKLVLNFDPENDPMGILMIIDSLALLSQEYEWICAMQQDFKLLPLQYFPNFTFSGALAVFSLQHGAENVGHRGNNLRRKNKKGKATGDGKEGSGCVSTRTNQTASPHDTLTNALLAFPMALRPLLAATKDSGGSWSSHRLFSSAHNDGFGGVLCRMCRVYAERSNLLWNSGEARALLHKAAIAATEIADAGDKDERNASALQLRQDAAQWLGLRGLYRTVQVADFADGSANLSAELLADNGPVGEQHVRQVTTTEAVREFMQSFLPWRNAGDAANNVAASGGQPLEAMWEMLENLNILPDRGGAGDQGPSSNGNSDPADDN